MDEFLWALNQKVPGTSSAQCAAAHLRQPGQRAGTLELHAPGGAGHSPVTSDDYITKTINLAKALKDQFPN